MRPDQPKEYVDLVPSRLLTSDYIVDIWGYSHLETGVYSITIWDDKCIKVFGYRHLEHIGKIEKDNTSNSKAEIIGQRTTTELRFTYADLPCKVDIYDPLQNIFSRNSGILETDWMLDKTAFIAGCGSVGSLVALELARSGVGSFVLIDNDIIAYHNICRHQCGVKDVGKFKVQALSERIIEVNPSAKVI